MKQGFWNPESEGPRRSHHRRNSQRLGKIEALPVSPVRVQGRDEDEVERRVILYRAQGEAGLSPRLVAFLPCVGCGRRVTFTEPEDLQADGCTREKGRMPRPTFVARASIAWHGKACLCGRCMDAREQGGKGSMFEFENAAGAVMAMARLLVTPPTNDQAMLGCVDEYMRSLAQLTQVELTQVLAGLDIPDHHRGASEYKLDHVTQLCRVRDHIEKRLWPQGRIKGRSKPTRMEEDDHGPDDAGD